MGKQVLGILGLGTLGRALAVAATNHGTEVLAWSRKERSRHREAATSGDAELPPSVNVVDDPVQVVEQVRSVFLALPAHAFREVVDLVGGAARGDHHFFHGTKGTDEAGLLMHEIIRGRTCIKQIGALGGPVMASELAKRGLSGLVVASRFTCALDAVGQVLGGNLKFSRSHDLVGVEVAGALRNVISVASGMADGLAENERSAVLARGLVETARFGVALGATPETFVGVAGVGDLLVRREAHSSRNYRLGQRVARGEPAAQILAETEVPVEGAVTARGVGKRALALGVRMPLTHGVVDVLDGKISAREMLESVLATDPGLGAGDSLVRPERGYSRAHAA